MANPQDAAHGSLSFISVLFSPNGRITQKQFWIGVVIILCGNLVLNYVGGLGILLWGLLVYMGFCVYGKRLHDIGKSTWVHAIVWLVVFIISIGATFMSWGALELLMSEIDPANVPTEDELVDLMNELGPELMAEIMPVSLAFIINIGIWLIYTIWLGTNNTQRFDNRFGRGPAGDTF